MFEKYRSNCYSPEKVKGRYVKKHSYWHHDRKELIDGGFMVVETNDASRSVREYTCDGSDIPESIRRGANDRVGYYPPYVEWPL